MINEVGKIYERPWGTYEVLHVAESGKYQVKRIEVKPQSRLSYQTHEKRMEIWTIVQGSGKVVLDDEEIPVREGDVVKIPLGAKHRMWNTGDEALVFIEVQRGDYLGEDDIVRIEDDFDRID